MLLVTGGVEGAVTSETLHRLGWLFEWFGAVKTRVLIDGVLSGRFKIVLQNCLVEGGDVMSSSHTKVKKEF